MGIIAGCLLRKDGVMEWRHRLQVRPASHGLERTANH